MILPCPGLSQKLPVSVCLLTLNEEENLPRTLAKLDRFAELLVFDSGSTDETVTICREAGARVCPTRWEGFGKTRRKLFEAASQPWILWLDADEVLTDELLAEISALFRGQPEKRAYYINRIVRFDGRWIRHGEWFPDRVLRLFPADCWEMIELDVHESIRVDCPTSHLRHLMEHHSFRDWEDLEERSEHYARLWAGQRVRSGRRPGIPLVSHARSWGRFFKGYLLKLGCLDGFTGLRIALSRAREVRMKYRFWRELYRQR